MISVSFNLLFLLSERANLASWWLKYRRECRNYTLSTEQVERLNMTMSF